MKKRGVYILLVIFFILLTRLPFLSKYFFHWDTVQYVFGSQKYDFTLHHAHPPGYWVYVQIISLLNRIIKDYNLTIILINIICSIVASLCLMEAGRHYIDIRLGLIITSLFLLSPVLWLYNVVSINHMTLTMLPSVFLYYYFRKEPPHYIEYIMISLLAALWAGIRQVETFLLLPFLIVIIIRHHKPIKVFLISSLIFSSVFLFWFLPFIKAAGGWSNYSNVSKLYYTTICFDKSMLYGASLIQHVSHFPRAFLWLVADFGLFGLGMILLLFLMYLDKKEIIYPFNKKDTFALLAGILPLTLFYLAVYIGRPAYWFTLLPFLFFILSAIFYSSFKKYERKRMIHILLFIFYLFSLIYFIAPHFVYHSLLTGEIKKPVEQQSHERLNRFITLTKYSSSEVIHRDKILEIIVDDLRKFTSPKNSCIFGYIDFGGAIDWRRCSYYLPQIPFFTIIENKIKMKSSPMALLAWNNHVEYLLKKIDNAVSNKESLFHILIPERYRYFILIPDVSSENFQNFRALYKPQKIGTPLNLEIYCVDIKETGYKEITYGEMKFILSKEEAFKIK